MKIYKENSYNENKDNLLKVNTTTFATQQPEAARVTPPVIPGGTWVAPGAAGPSPRALQPCLCGPQVQQHICLADCPVYQQTTDVAARRKYVQDLKACFRCLCRGHYAKNCQQQLCPVQNCGRNHHQSLHIVGGFQRGQRGRGRGRGNGRPRGQYQQQQVPGQDVQYQQQPATGQAIQYQAPPPPAQITHQQQAPASVQVTRYPHHQPLAPVMQPALPRMDFPPPPAEMLPAAQIPAQQPANLLADVPAATAQ